MTAGRRRALERNLRLLDVLRSLRMALVAIPVIVLFWQEECGVGVDGVFVLQAIFSGVVLVCEVPSGHLGDRLGRRTTILLSAALNAAGFVVYAGADSFATLVAAEVVLAVGMALWSGTDAALQYETMLELGRVGEALGRESRALFLRQSTEAAASVLGGLIAASLGLRATVWATVVPFAAVFLLAFWLVEPARGREPAPPAWRTTTETLRDRRLRPFLGAWALLATGTLTGVWLHQILWRRAGLPIAAFGWAWAALNLAVAGSALLAGPVTRRLGRIGALVALGCWMVVAFAVLGLWVSPAVVLAGCALNVVRGVGYPIVVTALNDRVGSERRATVLSVQSLLARMGFALWALPVGWIGSRHGLTAACLASGVLLGAGAVVWLVAGGRQRRA